MTLRQKDCITLGDIVRRNARNHPHRLALVDTGNGLRFTFRELNNRINQCAHMLKDLGIRKGDALVTWSYNQHEYIETRFAAAKLGAITVPIGFRLAAQEMGTIAEHSNAKLLVFDHSLLEKADLVRPELKKLGHYIMAGGDETPPWAQHYERMITGHSDREPEADVLPDDIEALLYTSGTTGLPKGVVRTHSSGLWAALTDLFLGDECWLKDTVRINAMPLFHMGGFECGFLPAMMIRGTNILMRTFDPNEFLKIVEKERVTEFFLVPAALSAVVDCQEANQYDVRSLRYAVSAAAPLPVALREKTLKVFKDVKLYVRYGSTELGTSNSALTSEKTCFPNEPCIGRGSICADVRVLRGDGTDITPSDAADGEVGEIAIRGPSVMLEYYMNPEETEASFTKEGYLLTGDMARMDTQGNLYIAGRSKDVIISGGENIYPAEIENILLKHARIEDATVIGVAHEKWGETPQAIVVTKPGDPVTEEEIIEYCRSNLARYKCPTSVLFVESIPRSPAGKVQKYKLVEVIRPS